MRRSKGRQGKAYYSKVRSERRLKIYRYARDVLKLSTRAAKECSYSCSWMLKQFPEHEFPEEIRSYAGKLRI